MGVTEVALARKAYAVYLTSSCHRLLLPWRSQSSLMRRLAKRTAVLVFGLRTLTSLFYSRFE